MNLKKLGLLFLVLLLSVFLFASVAEAKKKKKKKVKKGISNHIALAGADLGANVAGFIPYSTVTIETGGDEQDSNFSGTGGFGPYFGGHAHLHFSGWIIRGEMMYAYQSGTATHRLDEGDDVEFDYAMNNFMLGVGFGKTLIRHYMVHPYLVGVLDYHYLTFRDKDEDESAGGSGVGVGGVVGADVKIMKTFFVGGGARLDLIYTLNPLTLDYKGSTTKIAMGYIPVKFFLTGGYLF